MRATLMYRAGDVRVQDAPDPAVQEPTNAVVRVLRGAVCGSDLSHRVDAAGRAGQADGA